MTKSALSSALLGTLFVASLAIAPAHAQATRTWVSGVGDDANPCSRTAPCKTFASAISKTATNGEIDVLDPGGFGAVTITKSISIYNDGVGEAGVLVSGTNGIIITGAATVVNLRGLIFDGLNTGINAVLISVPANVTIMNCVIQEFASGAGTAGVNVANSSGTVNLKIMDTTIIDNNAGVFIKPTGGAIAKVSIDRSRIDNNNGGGVRLDGTGGGTVNAAITDSSMSLNAGNGVIGISGPGNVNADLEHDVMADNAQSGVASNNSAGGAATVTVGSSILSNNVVGAWSIVNTATLLSYKNNQVTGPTGSTPGMANFQ